MRTDILKTYKTLHTWTGLICGIALFICFFAGALTMFEEQLDRWATPPQQKLPWIEREKLPQLIERLQQEQPQIYKGFTVHVSERENTLAPISWTDRGESQNTYWYASLDADDNLLVAQREPSQMADLIDHLHQTAGIPGKGHHYYGVYVMGAIAILYALALFSGVILLLPTLAKDFFAVRKGKNLKRFWLDTHNVIGITSLPFHIVITLTVIVFAFHDQFYDALQEAVYGDRPIFERSPPSPLNPDQARKLWMPDELLARTYELSPAFTPREIHYSRLNNAGASARIAGENDAHMLRGANRGFVTFDAYTGDATSLEYLPGYEDSWTDVLNAFFALHFGNYGGSWVRWIYFALGLSGAYLFYSGNLLWIESRRRKQRRDGAVLAQPFNVQVMAALTVGSCWGCVAAVISSMVIGKWWGSFSVTPNGSYLWSYYLIFIAAVAWAFWAGAARALVHLLWLCAGACAALLVTGIIGALIPGKGLWLHTSGATLAVEATALIGGLAFALMAHRTRQRVQFGPHDSIWSYTANPPRLPLKLRRPATETATSM
jgi:hypothetical protein